MIAVATSWEDLIAEFALTMTKGSANALRLQLWQPGELIFDGNVAKLTVFVPDDRIEELANARATLGFARLVGAYNYEGANAAGRVDVEFVASEAQVAAGSNDKPRDVRRERDEISTNWQPPQVQPGQVAIDVVSVNPTKPFVAVPHYAARYWRPFMGVVGFALWEVLRSYGFAVRMGFGDWPTVELLVDTLGAGVSRASLMGRNKTATRQAQVGAIARLEGLNVLRAYRQGDGRQTRYSFKVIDDLPMLTPSQVFSLPARKREEHATYISRFKGFNVDAWSEIGAASLIPASWYE